jgi:ATP-dependent Clp protease ATP-binding subunit ClpA
MAREPWTLGRDLTELAASGKLDPITGRDGELDEVTKILCRRNKGNPLILGEPGVGKTALAEGLALRLCTQPLPAALRQRRLVEIQLGSLLAGTQYRGDLELKVSRLLERAAEERLILFIDEVHLIVQAGRGSGMDAANLLKPVLSRGEISCIGATTSAEANALFATDPALERRFQPVHLAEPGPAVLRQILATLRPRFEAHHQVSIDAAALDEVVRCAAEPRSPRRKNPDWAIDLLEEACTSTLLTNFRLDCDAPAEPEELARLRQALGLATDHLDLEAHTQASLALSRLTKKAWSREKLPAITADAVCCVFRLHHELALPMAGAEEVPKSPAS